MFYTIAISLIGLMVAALGVLGFAQPTRLMALVTGAWQTRAGLYLVATVRIIVGLLLIAGAVFTRYPHFVAFVGYLALVTGVSYPIIGYERMRSFVHWWQGRSDGVIRAWSLAAIAFGVWLVYAAWPATAWS